VEIREMAQEDLGLSADSAPDLDEVPGPAEGEAVVDPVLQESRLTAETGLLVGGEGRCK